MNFISTTLPISIPLSASASATTYQLNFRIQKLEKVQARFQGRRVLVPEIDLDEYTCRAVIDWLEVRINIISTTQWKWIQHYIEKETGKRVLVKDVLEADGSTGRQFRIRFQEPMLGEVKRALAILGAKWTFIHEPELIGIEISLDLSPNRYSEEALAKLFGVVARTHLPSRDVIAQPEDRPRFVAKNDQGVQQTRHVLPLRKNAPQISGSLLLRHDRDITPTVDSTYYTGARGSRCSWRLMVKRIDQQNRATGSFRKLADDEVRVRLEVTILEPELMTKKLRTLDDLAKFQFQTLQGSYFQFRLPTFRQSSRTGAPGQQAVIEKLESERMEKFVKTGVVGLEAMDDARARQLLAMRRASKGNNNRVPLPSRRGSSLTRYGDLTKKVVQALRHLGDRQRKSFEKHSSKLSYTSY